MVRPGGESDLDGGIGEAFGGASGLEVDRGEECGRNDGEYEIEGA